MKCNYFILRKLKNFVFFNIKHCNNKNNYTFVPANAISYADVA